MAESLRDVFNSIFGAETGNADVTGIAFEQSPTYGEVLDFVGLLTTDPAEEQLHVFVRDHPRFLLALHGWADDAVLAVFSKPRIGIRYCSDFAVLIFGQGGCAIHLIELEPANIPVFTKRLSPARRYQEALAQIQDWGDWIIPNKSTFVRDMIDSAKKLPQYPARHSNGSFRTRPAIFIEEVWRGFSGFENCAIQYSIIIGRWSNLSESQRKRLVSRNRQEGQVTLTFTYDQLIRRGIERPFGRW